MATRKNRQPVKEDAFGAPPASRGSMMNVAGASDDDRDGEELLSDSDAQPDEYRDNDTLGAPFYAQEGVVRIRLGDLRRLVRSIV